MGNKEFWKVIPGYDGRYFVSNFGRVKTLGCHRIQPLSGGIRIYPEKVLKLGKNTGGYFHARLSVNGITNTVRVNRLVAFAFISNPENKPNVNHINGIKTDNYSKNLEWCTQGENNKHARETGLNNNFNERHHSAKLKNKDIKKIRALRNSGKTLKSIADLYSVSISSIHYIISNKTWVNL